MQLPQQAVGGSALVLMGYGEAATVNDEPVNGTVVATFGPPAGDDTWLVSRIVVQVTGQAAACPAVAYAGDPGPTTLRDGTDDARLDISDGPQPLILPATRELFVVFSGLDAGAKASCHIDYAIMRPVRV